MRASKELPHGLLANCITHRNLVPLPWYKTKMLIRPIYVSSIDMVNDMVNCNFLVTKFGLLYSLKLQRNYAGPLSLFSSLLERKDTNAVLTTNADKKHNG
jgi:hypothetical protein